MKPPERRGWRASRGLIALAVGYQWLYNGVNFLAFKISGDALHPVMVATLRFAAAAAIVLPFALWRMRRNPVPPSDLRAAALLGTVMLVLGQAVAIWGTHFLPAGVAAVFASAAPLFLALFSWGLLREPLSARQVAGVALGFSGLALLGLASFREGDVRPVGVILALAASASWAAGSLLARRLTLPKDPVVALAAQLVTAAVVLACGSLVGGLFVRSDFASVPPQAWAALAFLVIASTIVGYALFIALNEHVSSMIANTFNFAAPVVALGLAFLVLGEPLTWTKVAAAVIALVGVALMIAGEDRVRA